MKIVFFIIFIIGAIIIFKTKDERFPNHPYLGWIVCMIIMAACFYIGYNVSKVGYDSTVRDTDFKAGYKSVYQK